ncbi:DUF1207 domain-containing protein [Nitrospira moscoviensis]|uniref:DUF1207 domain-containing protein n=1 Tax=Nitrospira moscoviensis TaxID=42253 RepID=A0A0K2GHL1_NITMO|nr:DUF1207 domain-containing protein [Nitrospira moscoviensis]ALA60354.1 conserved exported protein of unknown function [Nitrospira moscoviensis]
MQTDRTALGSSRVALGVAVLLVLAFTSTPPVIAEEKPDPKPVPVDCRYAHAEVEDAAAVVFPVDDVFRPLIADPKQPQFFATWQFARARTEGTAANVGSVALGENFGLYTKREGCNGWQFGLLTGVFSQFNMDAPSTELINTDFVVGFPVTWRSGDWSTRVRYFHQSSHVGDEFLLGRAGFNRLNFSYEEIEAIVSYDYRRLRVYAGGGYLMHREPASFDRNRAQWGFEARGPTTRSRVLGAFYDQLLVTPVLAADFKSIEELHWIINTNVVAGLEWSRAGAFRRFRILVNYYHGFNPYGQFFAQKVESVGAGLYFMF